MKSLGMFFQVMMWLTGFLSLICLAGVFVTLAMHFVLAALMFFIAAAGASVTWKIIRNAQPYWQHTSRKEIQS